MRLDETRLPCFLFLTALLLLPAAPAVAEIKGNSWLPIGPAPGTFAHYRDVSGRATVIAPNPADADDLWLGTAQGGVWHSTDGGESWTPETDDRESLAVGAIALSGCIASGCGRVFVGTGENAIRRDTFYGQGLLLGRLNAGEYTWEIKKGNPYDFSYSSINDVVLDPTTSGSQTKIFVTVSSGVTASSTESTETAPELAGGYGIFRSMDEGNSWEKLVVPLSSGARPTDLEMDPGDPDTLYAGFLRRGIFKTTDGGDTWCPLGTGLAGPPGCPDSFGLPAPATFDFVEIATFAGDSNILYATLSDCPDPLLAECRPEIWKTVDAGANWTLMSEGYDPDNVFCMRMYSRYTHALTVDPTDSATVLLGGITLCRSEDSGVNWEGSQFQKENPGKIIHPDHRQEVFFESNPQIAFDVNDGGVARSDDGGNTWTQINGNLQTFGFQSIASSPLTARVIGGAQDNAGQMWTGSGEWEYLDCCGDGGFSVMDLDNPLRMYVTSNQGDTNNTSVIPKRSNDGGASFAGLNTGLDNTDPQSFYSPLVQELSGSHRLYFGTNRLYRSDDNTANWTVVSPVLSVTPQTGIFAGQDAITAIAIAPSDTDRIYLGYFSGKVFRTDNACNGGGCWDQKDSGLPSAPITWIAVDPTDPDTAYATLGGFFDGVHVYKTEDGGDSWDPTAGHSKLDGVPANTIAIEPSAPDRLWLGTDVGVYKSICSGCLWFQVQKGMPNVPVFQFSIDESRERIFAGTHGRGAFVLTAPRLLSLEGWVDDQIWDIPLLGSGFLPGQNCTIKLARQDLTVCAQGGTDAFGGTPTTDDDGVLVSDKGFTYQGLDVVWACNQGTCVNDTPIEDCNQPGNELAVVLVLCGQQVAIHLLSGCPSVTAPPSSWAGLTGLEDFRSKGGGQPSDGPAGMFELLPVLFAGDGSTQVLCRVDVPVNVDDSVHEILLAAETLVDNDAVCIAGGVSADLVPGREEVVVEDLFPAADHLKLDGPGLTGGQLVPSICTEPGQATGMCFDLNKLGVPVLDLMQIMRVRFETAGGASGGEISLTERSLLGTCEHTITTSLGDSAGAIAQALEDVFQASGIPGPENCRSAANPRDLFRHGNSVVTVLPVQLEICVDDPTVGFCAAPEEICFADADCEDGNPCTSNTCDVATGQCMASPEPNGTACNDGNPCTTGNTCNSGTCGVPLDCDDSDSCTEDSCDPITGGCANPPVVCDDGNVCTLDSCLPTSGDCQFAPSSATCDDGDPCTTNDICDFDPLKMTSTCRGLVPTCSDGDPCTDDVCDPVTGACGNPAHDCEDGNPCTIDFCAGGACDSTLAIGMICDDEDPCTQGDFCQFSPPSQVFCQGPLPTCSDGDVCTDDICDPVFGTCDYPPTPLEEAGGLLFTSKVRFSWTAAPGTLQSNTYRGTIPANGLASRPIPYDHVCFEAGDGQGNGATVSEDFAIPPPGEAFYYDNTLVLPCGEGPLGSDSSGTPRPAGTCLPV